MLNSKNALKNFNEIRVKFEDFLDTPKGTEYLIRLVTNAPRQIIGSGLVNDLINNLPFELHRPGMNYLGPGTKLEQRLERGDKPVNQLDEAAMYHDVCYRDNEDLKNRHMCDKELENEAMKRVLSKDAEFISERLPAFVTANAMKIKRYLGMGLEY